MDSRSLPDTFILPQKASLEKRKTCSFAGISDVSGTCQETFEVL
jgi:hypothetical protein